MFGLFCRLPTEQETHLSMEREMSPTWLLQACVTSLIGWLSLCSAGVAGASTLRREAMTHLWGHGLATIQCHLSGFLNKMESALRSCLSKLPGRSPLRSQEAQRFLTGSQEGAEFTVFVVKHMKARPPQRAATAPWWCPQLSGSFEGRGNYLSASPGFGIFAG